MHGGDGPCHGSREVAGKDASRGAVRIAYLDTPHQHRCWGDALAKWQHAEEQPESPLNTRREDTEATPSLAAARGLGVCLCWQRYQVVGAPSVEQRVSVLVLVRCSLMLCLWS